MKPDDCHYKLHTTSQQNGQLRWYYMNTDITFPIEMATPITVSIYVFLLVARVSFSQSKFNVMENGKAITIELVRSGDTSTEAVVLIGTHPYKGSATGQ